MTRRGISLGTLFLLALGAAGCRSVEDKRLYQYLNREGFGRRYQGNATEENYASVGDTFLLSSSIHPTEFNRPAQVVDLDGTIDLPEIGSVHVAGLTEREIEALLAKLYEPYYEGDLRLQVTIRGTGKVYFVAGEIGAPGPKPLAGDLTLVDAVFAARPNPLTANLGRVRLVRGDPIDPLVVLVDVTAILEEGDTTYNLRLREDDIIIIPPTILGTITNLVSVLFAPVINVLVAVNQFLFASQTIQFNREFF